MHSTNLFAIIKSYISHLKTLILIFPSEKWLSTVSNFRLKLLVMVTLRFKYFTTMYINKSLNLWSFLSSLSKLCNGVTCHHFYAGHIIDWSFHKSRASITITITSLAKKTERQKKNNKTTKLLARDETFVQHAALVICPNFYANPPREINEPFAANTAEHFSDRAASSFGQIVREGRLAVGGRRSDWEGGGGDGKATVALIMWWWFRCLLAQMRQKGNRTRYSVSVNIIQHGIV